MELHYGKVVVVIECWLLLFRAKCRTRGQHGKTHRLMIIIGWRIRMHDLEKRPLSAGLGTLMTSVTELSAHPELGACHPSDSLMA